MWNIPQKVGLTQSVTDTVSIEATALQAWPKKNENMANIEEKNSKKALKMETSLMTIFLESQLINQILILVT